MNPKPLAHRLVSPEGFDAEFFAHLPQFKTASECFYHLNGIYEETFGVPRYSDYKSYSVMKAKRLRNIKS